jgi:hypothetical protein
MRYSLLHKDGLYCIRYNGIPNLFTTEHKDVKKVIYHLDNAYRLFTEYDTKVYWTSKSISSLDFNSTHEIELKFPELFI